MALAPARQRIDAASADAVWRAGRITPVDQALGLALDLLQNGATAQRHTPADAARTAGITSFESNSSVSGSDSNAR